MGTSRCRRRQCGAAWLVFTLVVACSEEDSTRLFDPRLGDVGPRPAAFLNFPSSARSAPLAAAVAQSGFPLLLSDTGAFRDVSRLEPEPSLVPYDLLAPLWSDGSQKRRWLSLPELGSVRVSDEDAWRISPGTVLVKHFEMQLDERQPERRKLETRFLIAAEGGSFYGVTYRWNEAGTDAELQLQSETETLSIIGTDGVQREQPYYYPGTSDCITCHTSTAGYVLGLRTRQLHRELEYVPGAPAVNQLVAWSTWGLLDRGFDEAEIEALPRLSAIADESEPLEMRIRSYWDSNCAMCHSGSRGSVSGWDARYFVPLEDRGLDRPPQMLTANAPDALVVPGDPEGSYIYLRSATTERSVRMPPIGRNRIDQTYVDALERWIDSL
jgi:uncharacterized repeat protein (TIGR03806 family)